MLFRVTVSENRHYLLGRDSRYTGSGTLERLFFFFSGWNVRPL